MTFPLSFYTPLISATENQVRNISLIFLKKSIRVRLRCYWRMRLEEQNDVPNGN